MRIFLIGYMGCGKSSIGRALAQRLGVPFFDTDTAIEQRCGASVSAIFAERGEAAFRALESDALAQAAGLDQAVVATGGGAPCFGDNLERMNAAGLTVYFKMSPEKLASRLYRGKHKRPLIADKSDAELLAFIALNLEKREPCYSGAKLIIQCDGVSDQYIAEHVINYLENYKKG